MVGSHRPFLYVTHNCAKMQRDSIRVTLSMLGGWFKVSNGICIKETPGKKKSQSEKMGTQNLILNDLSSSKFSSQF